MRHPLRPQRTPSVDAPTLIAALEIVAPAPAGKRWQPVCPDCLRRSGSTASRRTGGQCGRCPYAGPATVVALLQLCPGTSRG